MASIARLQLLPVIKRVFNPAYTSRLIQTTQKNKDTITADAAADIKCPPTAKAQPENWVSYGFDFKNKEEDENAMNATMFLGFTCCIVLGAFIWGYMPDMKYRDWAQREAFLEIRRRESAGLPHVDCNLVDASKVILPSDDELGDTEIII